jgi:uncharacterized membrane protein
MKVDRSQFDVYHDRFHRRLKAIQAFQAKHYKKRTAFQKIADRIVTLSGSFAFLIINVLAFFIWILWNSGLFGVKPFDPFPFVLLTTFVSLEAIILAIFVLISQNRQSRITDLREEVDLQINMIAEEEITKLIQLIAGLYRALNVDVESDADLRAMLQPTDWDAIEKRLEHELAAHE